MTETRTLVIEPTRGWRALALHEVWQYRDLLYIFTWRDLKVRYRQTFLGAVWVMGQPLVTMLIFTLLFNRVARLNVSTNVPYPLFVLSGILIWNFVSGAIARAGNSLLGASFLISKVYFPRLIVPLSNLGTDLFDFAIAGLLLVPVMLWYGVTPGLSIFLIPFVVLLATLFALGVGLWLAALNVEYRDIRILVPWVLQIGMYVTPVAYPLSAIPERYQWLAVANPATGIVDAFRACIFGTAASVPALAWAVGCSVVLVISGAFYFRRMERRFADVL
jgi:lipopolysaccharide transport system permease protein